MSSRSFSQFLSQFVIGCAVAAFSFGSSACSSKPQAAARPPLMAAGSDAPPAVEQPSEPICPPDNPFCTGSPTDLVPTMNVPPPVDTGATQTCSTEPLDLTPAGTNIMIAVDGSASMGTHWKRIQNAISALRKANPDAQFGLQLFWGEVVESLDEGLSKANWCGKTSNKVLDVGANSAPDLISFLGDAPPGPAFFDGQIETSPVIEPLNYF